MLSGSETMRPPSRRSKWARATDIIPAAMVGLFLISDLISQRDARKFEKETDRLRAKQDAEQQDYQLRLLRERGKNINTDIKTPDLKNPGLKAAKIESDNSAIASFGSSSAK